MITSKPEVVVFDLGKVLLDFDYSVAARKMTAESNVSAAQIQSFIDQSQLLIQYEKGHVTRQEFFEDVRRLSTYRGTLEQFSSIFSDVFTPIQPMIELKQRLTQSGIRCYLFSNTNELAIEHIKATYAFYNEFDGYVLSYEHGFMKPEAQLYEAVEEMTGKSGPTICYIDDRADNIAAASRRGWRALLQRTPEETFASLAQQGLPVWPA